MDYESQAVTTQGAGGQWPVFRSACILRRSRLCCNPEQPGSVPRHEDRTPRAIVGEADISGIMPARHFLQCSERRSGAGFSIVHITAYCPECQNRYQFDADMRGRKVRCNNSSCQTIFVIREATSGANGPRIADARGHLVTQPPPSVNRSPRKSNHGQAPIQEFDWRHAPPPVQGAGDFPLPTAPVPPPAPAPRKPVREWEDETGRRHWRMPILLGLLFVVIAAGSYGTYYYFSQSSARESALYADAEKEYQSGKFGAAAKKYRSLADSYKRSAQAAQYRFMSELSDVRSAATPPITDPSAALKQAEEFAKQHDVRDPLLANHKSDFSKALIEIAASFADAADAGVQSPDRAGSVPRYCDEGKKSLQLLARYGPRDSSQAEAIRARFDRAAEALAKSQERRRKIDEVLQVLRQARPNLTVVRRMAERYGVADDPTIRKEIARAETEQVHGVAYETLNRPPQLEVAAEGPPVILLDGAKSLPGRRNLNEVVLAVSRGILFALDAHDGRRLWAARVGLDSGELPIRVPARGDDPEMIIVSMADPPGITARNLRTGAVIWRQALETSPLGRPVEDRGRLFVAAAGPEGHVYDLDLRSGVLRGRFMTRQTLAGGSAFDPASQRLYVPAIGHGVFVFSYEAATPICKGMLPTNHPAGSLRGEPIIVSGEEGIEVNRYLILSQTDGIGAMKLRGFRLLDGPTESPLSAEVRLPGWSWFPPYHDPESIAIVTDSGSIGLFGIQQTGNDDPPLFPLLAEQPLSGAGNVKSGRAQLVHAEEHGFWALANGVLRHWRLGLSRTGGRQLVPVWAEGVALGSPLHAAQVSSDHRTLFLVTQTDSPPAFRASAIDAQTGTVLWQVPLGITSQGDPIQIEGAVVVLSQAGGLYRFEAASRPVDDKESWQSGGKEVAPPIDNLVGMPRLLQAGPGQDAWAIAVRQSGAGFELLIRKILAHGSVTTRTISVPAPICGTSALGPSQLVLPLADGQLCWVRLNSDTESRVLGPDWRVPGTRSGAQAHVVHWRDGDYLVNDGGRQWRVVRTTKPSDEPIPLPLELPQRVVGSPARLPSHGVVVADVAGRVTLIRGEKPTPTRTWSVGNVTAGPWVIGEKIAVVVDRNNLVWLNPESDQAVWSYKLNDDGIEAAPRMIENLLVVADSSGRFVAIDPVNGKSVASGFQLAIESAPAASVTEFGPGRLFAPLTDGTVLLLQLADLVR